jgi:uncharacterized protein YecE (DUF72 family)
MPKTQTVEKWLSAVPDDFKFCVKLSRYITHIKRLKEAEQPLFRFFDVFKIAKSKMGPVLIQLPPNLKFDEQVTEAFFDTLMCNYDEYDYALEARHPSWVCDEAFDLLRRYHTSWVVAQSGVGFPCAETITAKHIYLRFHGPGKLFDSSYSQEMLMAYARKIRLWLNEGHSVWAFFNNTMNGHAIQNVIDIEHMILSV